MLYFIIAGLVALVVLLIRSIVGYYKMKRFRPIYAMDKRTRLENIDRWKSNIFNSIILIILYSVMFFDILCR